jgi:hypothetical protein
VRASGDRQRVRSPPGGETSQASEGYSGFDVCVFFFHPAPDSNFIRQVIPKSSGLTLYLFPALFITSLERVPDDIGTYAG